MEYEGYSIYFDSHEQQIAGLPPQIDADDAGYAFELVSGLKDNCGARIQEISTEDTYETHHLHHANAVTALTRRFHGLERIALGLGGIVSREMGEKHAAMIVDNALAEIPDLNVDLTRLYEK
ncbi:MAG TPA: hypothetical protein VM535_01675 [Candidatus Saccharimonadales bacterium]|nr:hypothetical protein [Candidatus Saccharimonadales bacterium]